MHVAWIVPAALCRAKRALDGGVGRDSAQRPASRSAIVLEKEEKEGSTLQRIHSLAVSRDASASCVGFDSCVRMWTCWLRALASNLQVLRARGKQHLRIILALLLFAKLRGLLGHLKQNLFPRFAPGCSPFLCTS